MHNKSGLFRQLKKMGARRGSTVLFHSSLKAIGPVEGEAKGLLEALIEYFTADGGLFCVPTHTWGNLGTDKITLDLTQNESNLGVFPCLALADGRGIRSKNPTHSMVVFGDREKALAWVEGEDRVMSATAPEGCYGKLYREGGFILLAGVGQEKNTYLHCVDEMLHTPNRMAKTADSVTVKEKDGTITHRLLTLYETDYTSDISCFFPKFETAFRYHGALRDGFLGKAPAQLCDARKLKECVELIYQRYGGKDPLSTPKPIPPKAFCNP